MTELAFSVYGTPATKGSLKPVPRGKHIALIEDHATSKPWREAVKWAALEAIEHERTEVGVPFDILDGPVELVVVYTFAKPKSAPKTRRTWPVTRSSGDIDKLDRNVSDALVDAGVMRDDSQIVHFDSRKGYVGETPGGMARPGARIIARVLPEAAELVLDAELAESVPPW